MQRLTVLIELIKLDEKRINNSLNESFEYLKKLILSRSQLHIK